MRKIKEKMGGRYKLFFGVSFVFIFAISLFIFSPKLVLAWQVVNDADSLWVQQDVWPAAEGMTESADGNFIYVAGRKVSNTDSVTYIKKIAKGSGNKIWEDIGPWSDGINATYSSVASWSDRVFTTEQDTRVGQAILQEWMVNPDESLSKGRKIATGMRIHNITSDENNLYVAGSRSNDSDDTVLQSRSKINGALNWEISFEYGAGGRYEIKVDSSGVYIVYGVGTENAKRWKVGKYAKNNGANLWTTDVERGFATDMDINSSYLVVSAAEDGAGLYIYSLTNGNLDQKMPMPGGATGRVSVTDDSIYVISNHLFFAYPFNLLHPLDGDNWGIIDTSSFLQRHWLDFWISRGAGLEDFIAVEEGDNLIFYLLGDNSAIVDKMKVEFNIDPFTFSATPLRDATNRGWSADYSVTIVRRDGFNEPVNLGAVAKFGDVDLIKTWPDGNIIPAGESGPKIVRIQTKEPPPHNQPAPGRTYEIGIGTNFLRRLNGVVLGQPIGQQVDFYINQRPNAKVKAIGNTNINVRQSVKIRDDGSVDPDTLAPGNALTAVIADFNNDATLDINGNLIGIDKCFIVGDSGNICNALWPGSASSNPADFAGWSFQYNIAGAYSIRYFVFDDLIADAQAVNWTERFKSAGMATPIPVIVGPAPGQAPTAVIEIQNDNGMPIDQALPNQIFYAYAGKSSDSDGTIKQVSFCVDTTPEQGSVKVCDGSVMTWTSPSFDWDTPDFARGWLAEAKKLRGQISQPGTYAVYAVVSDNDRMISPVAMDKITIINPSPPTADDQSVATNEDTPVDITLSGSGGGGVTMVEGGGIHSLAIKSDGTVWGWGNNDAGEVGNDSMGGNVLKPNNPVVKFIGKEILNGVIEIVSHPGASHSLALKSDGTWGWGDGDYNQIGTGLDVPSAIQIGSVSNAVDISVGSVHSMSLDKDGYVWTWGDNGWGQLGDGTFGGRRTYGAKVSGLNNVVAIANGNFTSVALKSDGTVWWWGEKSYTPPLWKTPLPEQVIGLDNIISVAGGFAHFLALKSDGTVWAWGANNYGQLGDNQACGTNCMSPIKIPSLTNIISIAAGYNYSLALKSDGTVWAWGANNYGQLGDGTNLQKNIPVQVNNLTNVVMISGGGAHSLALKSDGTVWAWGANNYGQLGDGTQINRLTPIQTQFPSPSLTYTITSLPANGTLKTSAGTPITSVPFTLLDNIVNYTPKPNFFSPPTDPFKFKVNDGFQDSNIATITVTVNPISPLPPTSLTGSAFCAGSNNSDITLNWIDNSDNETGFKIYRGADEGFTPGSANLVTTTAANVITYIDTTPAVSTIYYYKIKAFNIAGDSAFAASPAITTLTCAPTFALIPASVSILVGGTAQFDGSYDPDGDGGLASTTPDRDKIAWSSDKSNIARINQTGLVTGVVAGSAIIKGEYKGLIATSSVTVDPQLTYTLTVTKSGSGSGTVTSAPAGINCGADCSEPYTVGKSVTLTAAPGDFPNKFMGWTGAGCSGTGTCTVIMDAVKTVDAKFYLPTFTLTPASASILAGATQQFDGCYDDDGTGTEKSAICSPADLLRTAITWTSSDNTVAIIDSSGLAKGVKAGSVTITGIYNGITATASLTVSDIPTFSLTVTKAGSGLGTVTSVPVGIDCGADCSKSYPFGASVTLTAAPVNSTVVWTAGCDSIDGLTCTVAMTGDKAVTATFTALPAEADIRANDVNTITVPYNSSVEIEWCGADAHPCANAVACKVGTTIGGSDISLTAISGSYDTPALTADTTYFLECVNNAGDASYDNVKITVSAQAAYILTVTKTGAGSGVITSPPPPPRINCQASCASDSASFTSGASVTLTADPTIGSAFAGWSGDADCSDGNLTMNAAKTCTATFNTRPAAINLLVPNWSFAQASQLGALKAFLKWQFSDSNLNPGESAYQLIADDDADKADPLIDTGKCSGYNNPDAKCRINLGVDKYPLHEQISLAYGQKYYWWVKVWNNLGLESSLKQYDTVPDTDNDDGDPLTFTTYKHEFPLVDFSWTPANPSRGEKVKFTDASKYYTSVSPSSPTNCNGGHCAYLWIVPADATIDNASAQNPQITFNSSGRQSVTLKVTDDDGYFTSLTKTLNLRQKLPSWREVKPE